MNFKLGWYQTLKIGTQNVKGPWRDSTSLLQKHWVPILKVKVPILNFWGPNWSWGWCWVLIWISLISRFPISNCTESKRIPGFGTGSLQGPICLFVPPFIFQGPYFHCFGFIQAKNVNSVGMYCMSKLDLSVLSKILHYYCVSIFGTGSMLHYWQILILPLLMH